MAGKLTQPAKIKGNLPLAHLANQTTSSVSFQSQCDPQWDLLVRVWCVFVCKGKTAAAMLRRDRKELKERKGMVQLSIHWKGSLSKIRLKTIHLLMEFCFFSLLRVGFNVFSPVVLNVVLF